MLALQTEKAGLCLTVNSHLALHAPPPLFFLALLPLSLSCPISIMSHRIPREYAETPQLESFPVFASPPSSPTLGLARQPSHDTLLPLIYITDEEGSPSPSPSSPCFPDDAGFPGPRPRLEPAFVMAPVHRPSFRGGLKAISRKAVKSTFRKDLPLLVAFAW